MKASRRQSTLYRLVPLCAELRSGRQTEIVLDALEPLPNSNGMTRHMVLSTIEEILRNEADGLLHHLFPWIGCLCKRQLNACCDLTRSFLEQHRKTSDFVALMPICMPQGLKQILRQQGLVAHIEPARPEVTNPNTAAVWMDSDGPKVALDLRALKFRSVTRSLAKSSLDVVLRGLDPKNHGREFTFTQKQLAANRPDLEQRAVCGHYLPGMEPEVLADGTPSHLRHFAFVCVVFTAPIRDSEGRWSDVQCHELACDRGLTDALIRNLTFGFGGFVDWLRMTAQAEEMVLRWTAA
jgi:hypothetical protein